MKLQDNKIEEIAQKVIAEGLTYSSYAWYYLGEETAQTIIVSAIKKVLADVESANVYKKKLKETK